MEKLDKYRNSIVEIMRKYQNAVPSCGDIEVQTIFDRENDHYQIINVGWQNDRRIYGCSLHIDIKNNKVWIQHNGEKDCGRAERVGRAQGRYCAGQQDIGMIIQIIF